MSHFEFPEEANQPADVFVIGCPLMDIVANVDQQFFDELEKLGQGVEVKIIMEFFPKVVKNYENGENIASKSLIEKKSKNVAKGNIKMYFFVFSFFDDFCYNCAAICYNFHDIFAFWEKNRR